MYLDKDSGTPTLRITEADRRFEAEHGRAAVLDRIQQQSCALIGQLMAEQGKSDVYYGFSLPVTYSRAVTEGVSQAADEFDEGIEVVI